ncbi:unnamed protein product [Protopolystoma xenopodis]|uniref:FH2 domain-containing protein n=1 Tax=Protopolystoma xenopodis TaxID=117903 RepID=A0A3S5CMZ5_9PLAT|nr:unnamed protein product [Protopolystoma xenopodis]
MASLSLRKSEKFRSLLEIVLAFGNYMNSSRRGMSYGFRIQSLEQLSETKSLDKRWTLLHFFSDEVELKFPHLLDFYEEFEGITAASKDLLFIDHQILYWFKKVTRLSYIPPKLSVVMPTLESSTV